MSETVIFLIFYNLRLLSSISADFGCLLLSLTHALHLIRFFPGCSLIPHKYNIQPPSSAFVHIRAPYSVKALGLVPPHRSACANLTCMPDSGVSDDSPKIK